MKVERRYYEENGETKILHIHPLEDETVKVKTCGNVKEIMYSQNVIRGSPILKISKTEYIDLRNGEIKQFEKQEKRADDKGSVARSLKNLRDLINANVTEPKKCRWVTLTYADNMQDLNKLYNDFKNFRKRFKKKYGEAEYINAVEPQARGAWHIHLILIFNNREEAPFIPNEELRDMWKQGFVKITALDNVDNIGVYLTAYLGDIPLEDLQESSYTLTKLQNAYKVKECDYLNEDGTKATKRVLKGARLAYYPSGMNIYRHSKGIKMPEYHYCNELNATKEVENMVMTYETTKFLTDEESGYFNVINYRSYVKPTENTNLRKGNLNHENK